MFLIDRSFQNWKSEKLITLAQRVKRKLTTTQRFKLEDKLLLQLEQELLEIKIAKEKTFAKEAEIKKTVKKLANKLKKTLTSLAKAVEAQCEFKSDITLSGFLPARIKRSKKLL